MYLSSDNDEGLKSILNDTTEGGGREAFLAFLKDEYAQENLEFYIVSNTVDVVCSGQNHNNMHGFIFFIGNTRNEKEDRRPTCVCRGCP
jgi:hypothetical protein